MSECYTYILRCADGTLYTGWTNNLQKRLTAHNRGTGARYTRSRRPVELIWWEVFPGKEEAMRRECQIKKLTRGEKLALVAREKIGERQGEEIAPHGMAGGIKRLRR